MATIGKAWCALMILANAAALQVPEFDYHINDVAQTK
jgi:hypothetical protein